MILQQLLANDFVQTKLTEIVTSIVANIVNIHITSLLCSIFTIHPYVDFVTHTGISVFLAINIDTIYRFVERFDPELRQVTKYLIENYSIENYRLWKRTIVLIGCGYACLGILLIELTKGVLFMYILQYAICFILIEQIEQRRIQNWLTEYRNRPVIRKLGENPDMDLLLQSYMSPNKRVLDRKAIVHEKLEIKGGDLSSSLK